MDGIGSGNAPPPPFFSANDWGSDVDGHNAHVLCGEGRRLVQRPAIPDPRRDALFCKTGAKTCHTCHHAPVPLATQSHSATRHRLRNLSLPKKCAKSIVQKRTQATRGYCLDMGVVWTGGAGGGGGWECHKGLSKCASAGRALSAVWPNQRDPMWGGHVGSSGGSVGAVCRVGWSVSVLLHSLDPIRLKVRIDAVSVAVRIRSGTAT